MTLRQCIMCASARPVAKGTVMKHLVHCWFQVILDNTLCYPVSYRRNAQRPETSLFLCNKLCSDRWWKVAARSHAIVDFIQVLAHVGFKHLNALAVYTCTSIFRHNFKIALIHHPFTYRKRFCLFFFHHSIVLLTVVLNNKTR